MSTKQMVAGAAIVRPPRPDSPPPPPHQYGGQAVSPHLTPTQTNRARSPTC